MRIVHEHVEGLALLDALHAAGHAGEIAQAAEDRTRVAAEAPRGGESGEQVAHVVAADQRGIDHHRAVGPDEAEGGVFEIERDLLGADLGGRMLTVGDDAGGGHGGVDLIHKLHTMRIVDVDDGDLRLGTGVAGEEAGLHVEVGVHRLVIVEVVAREVGEHGGAELQAQHALLVDTMGADLHHGLFAAGVAHLREHAENVEGLGGGLVRRDGAGAEVVVDRADETDALLAAEQVLDQVGDGGLAVGSGDADDLEVAVGELVETAGDAGERGAGVGDLDEGDLGGRGRRDLLRDHGDRASVHGLVDERGSVGAQAGEREEQRARHDATAVHHEPGDRTVEGAFDGDRLVLTDVVGEFGCHFEDAVADVGGSATDGRRAARLLKSVNESVVLREIADHRRPPSMTSRLRPGSITGLISRYWMSCSAMCLKLGAATVAP